MQQLSGIFLLNKTLGCSSNRALQKVKRLFQADKAGHTGTLDPLATGMLPICLGEATKFSQFLLDADKAYRTVMQLGVTTATGDAEGEVTGTHPVPEFTGAALQAILTQFTGPILQIPPMYSALKHEGKRLYQLAHQGITIDRPARPVTIRSLTLLDCTADTLTLDVVCSKGTYIRTLVEDIGQALGCGAHVIQLHRRYSSPFQESMMHAWDDNLSSLSPSELTHMLLPINTALEHLPTYPVSTSEATRLLQGQRIRLENSVPIALTRFIHDELGFIGIGEITSDGLLRPRRMMAPNQ